jgi:hypothetical protein
MVRRLSEDHLHQDEERLALYYCASLMLTWAPRFEADLCLRVATNDTPWIRTY